MIRLLRHVRYSFDCDQLMGKKRSNGFSRPPGRVECHQYDKMWAYVVMGRWRGRCKEPVRISSNLERE